MSFCCIMGRKYSSSLGATFKTNVVVGVAIGLFCGFIIGTFTRIVIGPCVRNSRYVVRQFDDSKSVLDSAYLYQDRALNGIIDGERSEDGFGENVVAVGDRATSVAQSAQPNSNNELPDWEVAKTLDPNADPGGGLVMIGVMTAKQYLTSRIVAAHQTWAKTIRGKVIYFSSAGSEYAAPRGIPVVGLPGVDDSYPPQKKSFMMLKYMHDYYKDKYEFFMRADDDIYIKGDKLATFLHSINSSKPLFIGQAGLGKLDEIGRMNLKVGDNFCMGGPGMVLSRETLIRVVPHISYCLKNLYTTHEDVEIGRCIRKFAQVSCTWAYEMQQIFHNNYKDPNSSFAGPLKTRDITRAVTLHPVKKSQNQFRLYQHFLSQESMSLRQQTTNLHRQINDMNILLQDRDDFYSPNKLGIPPSLVKTIPKVREEVLDWEFIDRHQYSITNVNPRRGLERHLSVGLEYVTQQVMEMINKNARQRGRTIDFKEILYGYHRVNPMYGSDYILDLLLVYKKHKGKRKMTVPVRRHAYLQQSFTDIEFSEGEHLPKAPHASVGDSNDIQPSITQGFFDRLQSNLGRMYGSGPSVVQRSSISTHPQIIHFILPLSGRFETFLHFIHNFEEVCLIQDSHVALSVMLFHSDKDDQTDNTVSYIRTLHAKYPSHNLSVHIMPGTFSRGIALQRGASLFPQDALLFFIDVDMFINAATLHRIRQNTIRGFQVYYPIVFSQYDPQTSCQDQSCPQRPSSPYYFSDSVGYWRQFGFGIAAMYNSDFNDVGGFDTDIRGWGKEDVDLYEKYLKRNVSVFRSVDPGLVHIFHPILCDPSLDAAQYQMCLGSKAASYASTVQLANSVYNTREILFRNEPEASKTEALDEADEPEDMEDQNDIAKQS